MAEDIKIFDGTNWKSLKGAEGPTVVSADVGNVARLGTDGKLLVAQADLDSRYVNIAGDTMTGPLIVKPLVAPVSPDGSVQVIGDNTNAAITVQRNADAAGNPIVMLKRSRGTTAAPTAVQANDGLGGLAFHALRPDGVFVLAASIFAACSRTPLATDNSVATQLSINVGDGESTLQAAVITSGLSILRSADVAGQINSLVITPSESGLTNRDPHAPSGTYPSLLVRDASCHLFCGGASSWGDTGFYADIDGAIEVRSKSAKFVADPQGNIAFSSNHGGSSHIVFYYDATESDLALPDVAKLAINKALPLATLDVGGDAIVRGPLEVTGDITSTGTAHSFAAGSIPSSAVIGSTAYTPANSAAGTAGSMRWDENFLYIRTATAWKRVALTAF